MTIGDHHSAHALPEGRFAGRLAFHQLVRTALACAAREGWQEIFLCDFDFSEWPLGDRDVAESLQAWSRRGRQITLMAQSYDEVIRMHARFVQWRKVWADIIDARSVRATDRQDFPSAIWTPGWMMQRHDVRKYIGIATSDASRRNELHEMLAEWMRKSALAFPASTLGL